MFNDCCFCCCCCCHDDSLCFETRDSFPPENLTQRWWCTFFYSSVSLWRMLTLTIGWPLRIWTNEECARAANCQCYWTEIGLNFSSTFADCQKKNKLLITQSFSDYTVPWRKYCMLQIKSGNFRYESVFSR